METSGNSDFVQSVITPNLVSNVSDVNDRKRQGSADTSADIDNTIPKKKKDVHEVTTEIHSSVNSGIHEERAPHTDIVNQEGNTHALVSNPCDMNNVCTLNDVMTLFNKFTSDMREMFNDVNQKIADLESRLEVRLKKTMEDVIDERLKQTLENEVGKVRTEFQTEIKKMNDQIIHDENSCSRPDMVTGKCNIVVKNLSEDPKEKQDCSITKRKVMDMIRNGLQLKNVTVTSATRKENRFKYPGVVIATIQTSDQKIKVMKAKTKLRSHRTYKNIYIEDEYPIETRRNYANMRIILGEMDEEDV